MLDDLITTIDTLRERLRDYGSQIGAYESRTRVSLIDPMLCALGWDVANPALVEIEPKTTSGGWADYGLLGNNGNVVMFVEAKKLTEDVGRHTGQAVTYAVQENIGRSPKVQFCAVTNGDDWKVIDVMTQDEVLVASLREGTPAKAAFKFLALWRSNMEDGSFVMPAKQIVPLVPPIQPKQSSPSPEPQTIPQGMVSLSSVIEANGKQSPTEIMLPGSTPKAIQYWKHVLVETARWLIDQGKLTAAHCPIRSFEGKGGTRYLLHTEKVHPSGRPFKAPYDLEHGIYVETNYVPTDLVAFTKRELERFGVDPARVYVRFQ